LIVPGIVLIGSGIAWLLSGFNSNISLEWSSFFPKFKDINSIVFLTGVFLFFAGMEVAAVHAHEVKNPQKTFPKAILMASVIIALIFILGAVSIAIIIPNENISLTAGIMETFDKIFTTFNVSWLIPIIAILVAPGMIAQILSWIGGPSKGLLVTAEHGMLPPFFQKTNEQDIPENILWIQGGIVTVLSLVFLIMPSVSSSFWILSALTVQVYLIMYLLLFISAIVLKYKEPKVKRAFKVPGGKIGMWIFAGLGIIASLSALLLGYFPPSQLKTGNILFFEGFLIIGLILMAGAPLIIYIFKKPEWAPKNLNNSTNKEKKDNASQNKES
jgi:amino acid transporter